MSLMTASACALMEHDQLAAVAVGQRSQQHAVDDAEDGGVGADAQRHGEDDDQREAGAAAQVAQAVANVLRGRFEEPATASDRGRRLLPPATVAEQAKRFTACRLVRHPARDVLLDQHVEVVLQLRVELPFETPAAE